MCKMCEIEKPLSEFYKTKKIYYYSHCKSCHLEYQRTNPKRKDSVEKYRKTHVDKIKEDDKNRYYSDIEKSRKYTRERKKINRSLNPDIYKKIEKESRQRRYPVRMLEPQYRIAKCLRNRFNMFIKKNFKKSSALVLLGCSLEELQKYLEQQFTEGMSWDNQGIRGWHIDHIIPCSSFDLTDIEQQKKCFHYTNLQPLWWYDNLSKSDKIEEARATTTLASSTTTIQSY